MNPTTAEDETVWVPPIRVDLAWFEPVPGLVPGHLRPLVLGLYDLLRRDVPAAHPRPAGAATPNDPHGLALRSGVDIPLLLGRPLADILRDVVERPATDTVHVVVVLLDEGPFQGDGRAFTAALQALTNHVAVAPSDRVVLLPVVLHPNWLDFPWRTPILDRTAAEARDAAAVARAVAVEVVTRGLEPAAPGGTRVSLFISRTTVDGAVADAASRRIRQALAADAALADLFDVRTESSDRLAEALRQAGERAMLLVLHTDHYGDSPRCEEEVLIAKQRGLPVVSASLLGQEERRSPPYGANMLGVVWRDGAEQTTLDQLLRVWLHHLHFRLRGRAVARLAGLAVEPLLLTRSPELLDFALGVIPGDRGSLVLYPDPPLPTVETGVLQRAYPRVRLVTPTTLAGCLMRPGHPIPALAGVQVSLSLSASPDVPEAGRTSALSGLTTLHVDEVIAHLTLCLVRAGVRLAYGGHLRRGGYTEALRALIRAHNQLGLPPAESLRNYVAAYLKDQVEIGCDTPPEWIGDDIAAVDDAGRALQLGRMRARMAADGDALVAMGGKTTPRGPNHPDGYVGRFPGILEEAWRTLHAHRPLFVIGGFGGAARWIADLLLGRPPADPALLDEAWLRAGNPDYAALCEALDVHPARCADDPASLAALLAGIREHGAPLRAGGEDVLWTNGLSLADNRRLFDSQSVEEIAHLVMKGLLRREAERTKRRASDPDAKPTVRLYHGYTADAPGVGAYAMAAISGTALAGDELHLDERMGGSIGVRLARARLAAVELLPASGQRLAGDWLCVAVMPPPADGDAAASLAAAARDLLAHAAANGLFDLAIASWGLAVGVAADAAIDGLLAALRSSPGAARMTLTLCEAHPARRDAVLQRLQARAPDISLVVLPADPAPPLRPLAAYPVTLRTQRIADRLQVSLWAPADDAGPLALCGETDWQTFERFGRSLRRPHGAAPAFAALAELGGRLANLALPAGMAAELGRHASRPLDIVHDLDTAGVSWESLRLAAASGETSVLPGLCGGVRRRLVVDTAEPTAPLGTASATRRVLLLVNPRADLVGADAEGDALVALLRSLPGMVVEVLRGPAATVAAVLHALEQPWDVLHYAGHAFFMGEAADQSGLVLADGTLSAEHVRRIRRPPPFVFLNACQSGRVRGLAGDDDDDPDAAAGPEPSSGSHDALARAFLTAGTRLFIGNSWLVQDDAARTVARVTYELLLKGAPVGAALTAARNRLFLEKDPDWANYVLYGDAAWQW